MNNQKTEFFKTNAFPLWVIAVTVALIIVPFRRGAIPNLEYFIVGLLLIYITGYFTLRQLIFKTDGVEIVNILYPLNKKVVRRIRYEEIYAVEIRNISGAYQLPYIILHYSIKSLNSNWFILRSGIFRKEDSLIEFRSKLIDMNVRVIEKS